MTSPSEVEEEWVGSRATSDKLRDALRRVLNATPLDRFAETPSALRARLLAEVGDGPAYRGGIHRLVMAADEQVPQTLSAAAPVDDAEIDRLARSLAATRGWSVAAAYETVDQWARALGVRSEAATSGGVSVEAPPRRSEILVAEPTALPEPGSISVAATGVPSSVPGPRPPSPAAVAAVIPGRPALEPWPRSSASRMRKASMRDQVPVAGVYRAFHPRSPVVLAVGLGVVLLLVLLLLVMAKVLVGFVPLLLAVVIGRLAVPEGHLVVDEEGGRFYRSLAAGAVPQVQFVWADTQIVPGRAPRIDTPQGPVWLWFGQGAVAAAAQSRSGRSLP